MVYFRSYTPTAASAANQADMGPITVYDAIVATLAFSPHWPSSPPIGGIYYFSAVDGFNSPESLVLFDAQREFAAGRSLCLFLSLGSGQRKRSPSNGDPVLNPQQLRMANQVQVSHDQMSQGPEQGGLGLVSNPRVYYKFSLRTGMANTDLPADPTQLLESLTSRSIAFCRDAVDSIDIDQVVQILINKQPTRPFP
jgi:hypothetical protein